MKKKGLIIVSILLLACIFITGCETKKEEKKQPENKKEEVVVNNGDFGLSQDEVSIADDSKMSQLFNSLEEEGKKIYEAGTYTAYGKKNGAYYIPLVKLNTDFGLDISNFIGDDGTACDTENSGIFFDTDKTVRNNYGENEIPVVPILTGCSQSDLQD